MRIVGWIIVLLLMVATAAGAAGYWIWNELNQPFSHGKTNESVTVARGASSEEILKTLKNSGIINSELPLKVYLKVKGGHPVMKAGDYRFPSPVSPIEVLSLLEKGGAPHGKITVIEGWTRFDIAKALKAVPSLKLQSDAQAMALLNDVTSIKDLDPSATNLEGYLFPDTYFVEVDSSAKDVVLQMVKRFRSVYDTKLKDAVKNSGLSLHNAVTVASIIETEAKLEKERPIVASVIYNRVRKGMRLSMDSTIVYASKMAGKWRDDGKVYLSDLNRDSPYNSRMYKGLPPGPVGSPGLNSLMAAVTPANTNYLYYVRDPDRNDGAHNYYSDSVAFDKGVEALRRWEKKQKELGLR